MQTVVLSLFVTAGALSAASVHTNFEGGALGPVQKVSDTHFRLAAKGERDRDGRNRQANWYYFRVDGAGRRDLNFDIVNLPGEYNYQPNRGAVTKDTPPVISYDGQNWRHIETFDYDPDEPKLILHVRPAGPRFWIAHTPPYTNETLGRLRDEIRGNPAFHEEVVGKTVGGRDLPLWTIGDLASNGPASNGKKTVWLMFRQHSWESGSSWTGEGAVRMLLGGGAQSTSLRDGVIWKIFPLCDPDGVARGGVRFNENGYDLNRNWDVYDSVKMPEITAQRQAIKTWLDIGGHINLFLSLHNTETSEYLQGPPEGAQNSHVASIGQHFFLALTDHSTFAPTQPLSYANATTTAGKPGRMTVIQGLYADYKILGFLMEQRVSKNPKLGHLPEISDRLQFGRELVGAIAETVRP
ncbi:MAG: M14-type cytosolic carboxypeptidase [Acidobacteriota bacterium]|nr:M14-type cytosolic carboxypeptidase [Acidobacteriota bacterium]